MVENKSSLFGIIALIIGASGLGLGAYSVVNLQVVEGTQGIPGEDAPGGLVVGILDPDDGETISGNVTIRALVYGSKNYTISVLRNGTEIGASLPLIWDTFMIEDGCWNITVIVMDVLTHDQSSDHVLVHVDNNPLMTRVYHQGNLPFTAGNYDFDFNAISYDPENCFNLTTDKYYVPKDGYYFITIQITTEGFLDGEYIWLMIINSTFIYIGFSSASGPSASSYLVVHFSDIQYLRQGDNLRVNLQFHLPPLETRWIYGGDFETFFSIMYVS